VQVIGRLSPMFDISLGMSPDSTGIENIKVCGALWGLDERMGPAKPRSQKNGVILHGIAFFRYICCITYICIVRRKGL
jgi:hypothetical protein